ncbi:MAG: hypothetical protein QOC82_2478 [Frankiaceae bacterium]|jgi:hypothetical protein|nr:hypothetical protein [Frankiaceae bacterium]
MGPSRITIISVVAAPTGWEARCRGHVLYWGPSLDRTVREARRLADLYDAHVVIEGSLSAASMAAEQDAADTMADYAW